MVHGGVSNGYNGMCKVLWINFKSELYPLWYSKGSNASVIAPGDAVIMNNGNDGDEVTIVSVTNWYFPGTH